MTVIDGSTVTETDARRGYKWIAQYRESLDPETDYEQIWRLSTCYHVNNFMMNFLYSVGFPHFILPPHGGDVISRTGHGKFMINQQTRQDDTVNHFWVWFERGPSDPRTQASVEMVNRIHAGLAKRYPGAFAHNDDFVYTLCWIGADMHRLRERIGLSGYTPKQKIAVHRHWQEMSRLFLSELGNVTEFPQDFEGMLEYMAEYEGHDHEFSQDGQDVCNATLEQWEQRWFPRGMRWFGRKMIIALWDEPIHRVHRIPYTSTFTRKFMEFAVASLFVLKEHILPDPAFTTPERNRRKRGIAAERRYYRTAA